MRPLLPLLYRTHGSQDKARQGEPLVRDSQGYSVSMGHDVRLSALWSWFASGDRLGTLQPEMLLNNDLPSVP